LALAPLSGHPQALLTPPPLDGLAVDLPAGLAQDGVGAAIAPPRVRPAELPQRLTKGPIPVRLHWLMALG
jgi:hypothetical protein